MRCVFVQLHVRTRSRRKGFNWKGVVIIEMLLTNYISVISIFATNSDSSQEKLLAVLNSSSCFHSTPRGSICSRAGGYYFRAIVINGSEKLKVSSIVHLARVSSASDWMWLGMKCSVQPTWFPRRDTQSHAMRIYGTPYCYTQRPYAPHNPKIGRTEANVNYSGARM